jgi:hypothetical protein
MRAGQAAGSWTVVERVIGWMRPGQIRSAPAAPARDLAAVLIAIQTGQAEHGGWSKPAMEHGAWSHAHRPTHHL